MIINNFTLTNTNVKYMEGSSTKSLNNFLSLLRKYDSISQDEEKELFFRYREYGDMNARDKIFLHNQRFIYSNAKIYARDSEEVMDYVDEGNIGLNEAIDKFNPSLDNKFITFAVWYIRRNMNYYLINTRDIIVKTNAMKLFKKADKVIQKYFNEHGCDPSLDEVKELIESKYGIVIKDISDLYDLNLTSISSNIDDDFTIEECDEYNEKTASQNEYEAEIDREYSKTIANKFLHLVPPKQRDIIKKLYGIGYDRAYTPTEVAQMYKMLPEDLDRLKNNIIKYMKQSLEVSAAV